MGSSGCIEDVDFRMVLPLPVTCLGNMSAGELDYQALDQRR